MIKNLKTHAQFCTQLYPSAHTRTHGNIVNMTTAEMSARGPRLICAHNRKLNHAKFTKGMNIIEGRNATATDRMTVLEAIG